MNTPTTFLGLLDQQAADLLLDHSCGPLLVHCTWGETVTAALGESTRMLCREIDASNSQVAGSSLNERLPALLAPINPSILS